MVSHVNVVNMLGCEVMQNFFHAVALCGLYHLINVVSDIHFQD